MSTRTVKRTTTRKPSAPVDSIAERLKQFLNIKAQLELTEDHLGTLKTELSGVVEEQGEADDKGHYWLELEEPVVANVWDDKEKTLVEKTFRKIKRQRTVVTRLDEEAAQTVLAKRNLLEECTVLVPVLDEEAINKAYFEKRLTKSDIDAIYKQTVQWSFRPQSGK